MIHDFALFIFRPPFVRKDFKHPVYPRRGWIAGDRSPGQAKVTFLRSTGTADRDQSKTYRTVGPFDRALNIVRFGRLVIRHRRGLGVVAGSGRPAAHDQQGRLRRQLKAQFLFRTIFAYPAALKTAGRKNTTAFDYDRAAWFFGHAAGQPGDQRRAEQEDRKNQFFFGLLVAVMRGDCKSENRL